MEVYYGLPMADENGNNDDSMYSSALCQSVDVHPNNMAVLMKYDEMSNRTVKVKYVVLICFHDTLRTD